jgi:cell division protein FtsI (penicillin-binding protein 3)
MGATLNGGYLRPLSIRKRDLSQALPGKPVLKPETSETSLLLMRSNVLNGSGGRANAPGLRVGGKTGSAEKPSKGGIDRKNLISSFAAVFPTDGNVGDDRYLVYIMFDSPQGSKATDGSRLGGFVAAPVAGRVINRIAPFLGVSRKEDRFTPANWDKAPVVNDEQTAGH